MWEDPIRVNKTLGAIKFDYTFTESVFRIFRLYSRVILKRPTFKIQRTLGVLSKCGTLQITLCILTKPIPDAMSLLLLIGNTMSSTHHTQIFALYDCTSNDPELHF